MKANRDSVEIMLSQMISAHRLNKGADPEQLTITNASYVLLKRKDFATGKVVSPLTFKGIKINVV